jgi:hypothetical protein
MKAPIVAFSVSRPARRCAGLGGTEPDELRAQTLQFVAGLQLQLIALPIDGSQSQL